MQVAQEQGRDSGDMVRQGRDQLGERIWLWTATTDQRSIRQVADPGAMAG
jgi:hypothetical protein